MLTIISTNIPSARYNNTQTYEPNHPRCNTVYRYREMANRSETKQRKEFLHKNKFISIT
jgi:hypothetical protein